MIDHSAGLSTFVDLEVAVQPAWFTTLRDQLSPHASSKEAVDPCLSAWYCLIFFQSAMLITLDGDHAQALNVASNDQSGQSPC